MATMRRLETGMETSAMIPKQRECGNQEEGKQTGWLAFHFLIS
jgi:hypothetical protein